MIAPAFSVMVLDLSGSRRRDATIEAHLRAKGYRYRWVRDARRAAALLRDGAAKLLLVLLASRSAASPRALREQLEAIDSGLPVVVIGPRPSVAPSRRSLAWLPAPVDIGALDAAIRARAEATPAEPARNDPTHGGLGERLRRARFERRLSLRQLSSRTGLSASLISQIERSYSSPSVATLFKMSRALRLKLSDLFAGF